MADSRSSRLARPRSGGLQRGRIERPSCMLLTGARGHRRRKMTRFPSPTARKAMATDKDFTSSDWQKVEGAPFMAGLAVTYSDLSNKVAIGDEASATGNAIKGGSSSSSEIVRTIAAR